MPAAALLFRSGGPQVALVGRDDRIAFRDVTIARDDGSLVELGSGVAPGDRLALNLSAQVSAGDLVKVNAPAAAAAPARAGVEMMRGRRGSPAAARGGGRARRLRGRPELPHAAACQLPAQFAATPVARRPPPRRPRRSSWPPGGTR